ncbi:MAG: hypothetical protein MUD00_03545 [Candidatus Pacebacteria bacterium]|nr:hypothetical protein [Candidatus Paceibacterota bacterium]
MKTTHTFTTAVFLLAAFASMAISFIFSLTWDSMSPVVHEIIVHLDIGITGISILSVIAAVTINLQMATSVSTRKTPLLETKSIELSQTAPSSADVVELAIA